MHDVVQLPRTSKWYPVSRSPEDIQDTVELAQGLGIKHVWIDSFCIIQDSHQDWQSEAEKMGDVYWNAALVVAASGAKDSTEGLFISDRPLATVLRLPYRLSGDCNGTFNMLRSPRRSKGNDDHPSAGPLEQRAWTLQERYLARRLITFMPNCVSWSCSMACVSETGAPVNLFYREDNWSILLAEYTKRALTYPTDRIEALRGIANLYQNNSKEEFIPDNGWEIKGIDPYQPYRKDGYIAEYGVWKDHIIFQLLWFNTDSHCDTKQTLEDIPSWSWAATGCAKIWPSEGTGAWNSTREAEEMRKRLALTSAGRLQFFGYLSTVQKGPSFVGAESIARALELDDLQSLYFLWSESTRGFYVLTQDIDGSHDKTVLGIARFDDDERKTYTHACFLAKQKDRSEEGVWRGTRSTERVFINDVVYNTEKFPAHVYCALLLDKGKDGSFKRVGIVILLSIAYEAFKVEEQKFEIAYFAKRPELGAANPCCMVLI